MFELARVKFLLELDHYEDVKIIFEFYFKMCFLYNYHILYSSASEFVTLTGPYRTVPFRFVAYHFRDLDLKNRGTVAKTRTVFRFL